MTAVESSRVIELCRMRGVNRVVVAPKQNNLAITVVGWNQCGMDGNDAI